MNRINTRVVSVDMIIDILENNSLSHIVLREGLKDVDDKQDRSFITRLVMGTVEKAITLDYIIDKFSKIQTRKMKPLIRNLLRMSVYQIVYMDSIPESAVCNEAVKIVKKRKYVNLSGFVNGVLRNIAREYKQISYPDENSIKGISIKYSCPEWIVSKFIKDYGLDNCKLILADNQEKSGITVRVNISKATISEVIKSLENQGVTVSKGNYLNEALILKDIDNIEGLEAFNKGYIQPQDESSMLVGKAAGVKENDYVIDVCSAPGGKSIHIADILNETGNVDSRDISEYKVNLINENIARTGFKNITAKVWDATVCDEEAYGRADVVIADVPCSGLGVLNSKGDIKYHLTEEGLNELKSIQRNILKTASTYVKQGGILIYSTCTINPEENIKNTKWFIENFDFTLESIDELLPEVLRNEHTRKGYLQLIQGIDKCDGFYIARLRRGKN
ncbi:MAG: 16S rRNA (cytosine(967)-C(5))-methyltransferase RsmB [Lachnospiraceae bacterium]|nr:16S rRNA (cytosine(967)-C(5))-methyltransferase RsmB [Lachnospiraceae bacterium]